MIPTKTSLGSKRQQLAIEHKFPIYPTLGITWYFIDNISDNEQSVRVIKVDKNSKDCMFPI